MHPEDWALLGAVWEKFFALNRASDYVTHDWILFWQVSRKIHLLPK